MDYLLPDIFPCVECCGLCSNMGGLEGPVFYAIFSMAIRALGWMVDAKILDSSSLRCFACFSFFLS